MINIYDGIFGDFGIKPNVVRVEPLTAKNTIRATSRTFDRGAEVAAAVPMLKTRAWVAVCMLAPS